MKTCHSQSSQLNSKQIGVVKLVDGVASHDVLRSMARPIPSNIPSVPPGPLDLKPRASGASFVDKAVETLRDKTYKYLMLGTISGWFCGAAVARVGRSAAWGLGTGVLALHAAVERGYVSVHWARVRDALAHAQKEMDRALAALAHHGCFSVGFIGSQRPASAEELQPAVIQKPEPFKPEELFERPLFPSKPVPHPPNIAPSSIPNPSPSVSVSAELPTYSSYLHNIPGFSAFRPVVSSTSQPDPKPPPPLPASTPFFSAPTPMMPAPTSMFSSAASLMPAPMAMYSAPSPMFSSAAPMIPALPPLYSATAPMFSAATPMIPVPTSMMPPSTLPTLLAPMPMIPVPMINTSMMPTLTAPTPMMPTTMIPTLTATTPMMPPPMMPAPMMPAPMMPAPMIPAPMMPAPMMPAPMMPAPTPMMPAPPPIQPAPTPMMPAPPPIQPAPTPVLSAPTPMTTTPAPLTTSQSMSLQTDTHNPDYQPFTITDSREPMELENTFREEPYEHGKQKEGMGDDIPEQQNFEDNFTMKIISPSLNSDCKPQFVESKMSITSLAQGSGGSVTIPAATPAPAPPGGAPLTMELRKPERFTLKTSIPISKIDIKSVSAPVDTVFQSGAAQKPVFKPAFPKEKERPKLEIQSNIIIKPATVNIETNSKEKPLASDREDVRNITTPPAAKPPLAAKPPPVAKPPPPVKSPPVIKPPPAVALLNNNNNNNITTLINAAEAINKNDGQFRVPEPKPIVQKVVKKKKPEDPPISRETVQKPKFKSKDPQPAKMQKTLFKLSVAEAKKLKQQNIGEAPAVARNLFAPRRDPNKPIPTHNQIIKKPMNQKAKPNALPPPPAIIRQAFGDYKPKPNFHQKPPDGGEQKNLIINQKNQNSKMVVTVQPNPQVLLQRTNFESKNLQAPSRLSSQSNRKEVVADTSSKVVALKKLHQDNCDENDFENLITENQIYGNKIVVKEKSQETQEDWRKTKDKQADPEWKNKLKVGVRVDTPEESKNVVLHPNFVYLSNVQFQSNLMVLRNPPKNICQTTDSTKMRVSSNENRTTESNIGYNNNDETNTAKIAKPQIISHREIHVLKSSNNVLQTLSNNNNKTEVVFQTNQKLIVSSQVVFQVPVAVTEPDTNNYAVIKAKTPTQKKEIAKRMDTKPEKIFIKCQVDTKLPKIVITSLRPKICTSPKALDEISTLDVYEQKKRLRRLKYLTNTNKDVPKVDPSPIKKVITAKPFVNVITPENMNDEIFRELSQTRCVPDQDSGASDSGDSDEDELQEYRDILDRYGPHHNDNAKADFLAGFSLATKEVFREKQLERHERTLRFDAVASAYLAASDLAPCEEAAVSTDPPVTITWTTEDKSQFLAQFNLMQVSQKYKAEYEKSWQEILRERDRRNGVTRSPEAFDPDGELQTLCAIGQAVLHNNDRIKRRLDSLGDERSDIRILAEKNFSELNRLSKMADRSVKLFSGKESRKRDLNPGFDSENIKKVKIDPKKLPRIKIPDISKIISLKTDQVSSVGSSSHATSMDEPRLSASCGAREGTRDVGTQALEQTPWPRVMDVMDHFIKEYREYEIARKREMGLLHRGNTALRVECAHVTRAASHESDRARALLAERRRLAAHEARLQASLELLTTAVQLIRMP